MLGTTGGYLVGYLLATAGARLRRPPRLGPQRRRHGAGDAGRQRAIYVPGLALAPPPVRPACSTRRNTPRAWQQTLAWGLTPYLIGDALKLALAALVVPGLWKLVGSARG